MYLINCLNLELKNLKIHIQASLKRQHECVFIVIQKKITKLKVIREKFLK